MKHTDRDPGRDLAAAGGEARDPQATAENERRDEPSSAPPTSPKPGPVFETWLDRLLIREWPELPPEILRQLHAQGWLPPERAERYLAGDRARAEKKRAVTKKRCGLVEEILFRGSLPAKRWKDPYSKETKELVLDELRRRGIAISERTLERYYEEIFYVDPDLEYDEWRLQRALDAHPCRDGLTGT
jgi:hypothetical protein